MKRSREKYTPRYTYSEWLHWEERGELIDGVPIEKSQRIGPRHDKAVASLKAELATAIREAECKNCSVGEPIEYKITNHTVLRPDVYVVAGNINKTYLDFPPVLIAEVISKVTEERDRGLKFDLYQQQGVKYYLIADAMKKSIDVYELTDGKYELKNESTTFFQLNATCKIIVDIDIILK